MPSQRSDRALLACISVLLLVSIHGDVLIPFGPFWGIDFQNLFVFHRCASRNDPYLIPGNVCGDMANRPMVYPPLLYWSFAWTRLLRYLPALVCWSLFAVAAMLWIAPIWVPEQEFATSRRLLRVFW